MAFFTFLFGYPKFEIIFAPSFGKPMADLRRAEAKTGLGALAQSVEQWTENPCVPGSIPGGTTLKNLNYLIIRLLRFSLFISCTISVRLDKGKNKLF